MSFKQKAARALCRTVRGVPGLNAACFALSNMYIDEYRFFSYDPEENGEHDIVRALAGAFPKKPVLFDAGANVGDWTSFAASVLPDFEAHLFEMSARTFETLSARLAGDSRVCLNNLALSDREEEIEYIDFGANDGGNTMLLNADYHKKKSVRARARAVRGDDYCAGRGVAHIDFFKIDTEGAEYRVLKGFEGMFARKAIDVVQFEYGYTHADAGSLMKDFFAFFEGAGYVVGRLSKKGVAFKSFSYADNDFRSGPNYIACLPAFRDVLKSF